MAHKIEHLGVAVRELAQAEPRWQALLGCPPSGREEVASEGVRISFFQLGESRVELLEPQAEDSAVGKFLAKRGEGIHHLCLAVDDLAGEVQRLRGEGFQFVGEAPRAGAAGHQVAFIHPKSAGGILVELSQGPE